MKDEDIQNLLGGFATDTLTDRERELLYTAALKDQKLFDALADEQALRELLRDPASRRQLLAALTPVEKQAGTWEWLTGWMRRPVSLAIAGSAIAALVVMVALRYEKAQPVAQEMAKSEARNAPLAAQNAGPASAPRQSEPGPELARRAKAIASPAKMKVAVLDFRSAPANAKEADVGKAASDLLGKKLDSSGYTVIDRKQVDQALEERKLKDRSLDAVTAATVGRVLGADAVIVGSVQPAPPPAALAMQAPKAAPRGVVGGAIGGFRQSESQSGPGEQQRDLQVTATAINTETASNLAVASVKSQQAPAALANAVSQVAVSLGQQIRQKAQNKAEKKAPEKDANKLSGIVTDVTGTFLTLDLGANSGVKAGDRLEVHRGAQRIGRVVITSVKDSLSIGEFQGDGVPQINDTVASEESSPAKAPVSN
jgi:hypothetical protein